MFLPALDKPAGGGRSTGRNRWTKGSRLSAEVDTPSLVHLIEPGPRLPPPPPEVEPALLPLEA